MSRIRIDGVAMQTAVCQQVGSCNLVVWIAEVCGLVLVGARLVAITDAFGVFGAVGWFALALASSRWDRCRLGL